MDVREAILARLVVIAEGIEGVDRVVRNDYAPNEKQTTVMVLDADEAADEDDPVGRGPLAPRRMTMTPQMLIAMAKGSGQIGSSLNAIRAALIYAVATDAPLITLTLNGRGARLHSTQTSLAWGRSMLGEMGVAFAIPYLLKPGDLAPPTA